MLDRPLRGLVAVVEARSPIAEPLALIAAISLLSSWAMQPYLAHALGSLGSAAQAAAQSALWLSGVLSPFAGFAKAIAAALVCWSCAAYLDERMSLVTLVSVFCVSETVFALRDLTLVAVLALRGVDNVRSASDLMVGFGLNAYVHATSAAMRIAFESWDMFSVFWALVAFLLIRSLFKTPTRSAAGLALIAFAFRTLFAAASLLYSL